MCSGEEEGASLQRGKQSEADREGGREVGTLMAVACPGPRVF